MNWRRCVTFGLVALFAVIVVPQWMQLKGLPDVLRQGRPGWLLVALGLQLLWFLNQAALYQSIYTLLALPMRVRHLLPIVLASNFVNFATPTASLGAVPLFLDDAQRQGLDTAKVTLTSLLRLLLNLVWFSLPLSFSLAVLSVGGMLRAYHLIAATILLATALLMVSGIALAGLRPVGFARSVVRITHGLNWVGNQVVHHDLLGEAKAESFAQHFGAAALALWHGRRRLLRPFVHSMLLDGLELGVLYAVFTAFPDPGHALSLTYLITGYTVGVLFSVVAITPQGLGIVEGTLVASFAMLGVQMGRATVVMLAYRVMSFWLPLLVGFAALRFVRGMGKSVAATPDAGASVDRAAML